MMTRKDMIDEYFEWLYEIVCKDNFHEKNSFRKLLMLLHSVEFTYTIPSDDNQAERGINLRWIYSLEMDRDHEEVRHFIDGPCSVLEMMVALAMSCENIMNDPQIGDRTGQWFWNMIISLGLGSMTDIRFDKEYCLEVIYRFLDREYEPDGKGGLFTIRNCDTDLRNVGIWYQTCWYLNNIS